MSDITREERDALHRFGDVLKRNFSQRPVAAVTRKTGVVRSVDTDQARLSVLCDGDDAPTVGVRCTTACSGVSVGDTVLVETFRGAPIVTSVMANSLDRLASIRQVFSKRVSFGSVQPNAFAETSVDISDRGCLSAPIVIPVSTGWVEAREATDVTASGFVAGCFNAGASAHSAVAEYICLELA